MALVIEHGQHRTNGGIRPFFVVDGFAVNIILIDNGPCLLEKIGIVTGLVAGRREQAAINLVAEPSTGKGNNDKSKTDDDLTSLAAASPVSVVARVAGVACSELA